MRSVLAAALLCAVFALPAAGHAAGDPQARIHSVVDRVIRPLMAKERIPGMAVGITAGGRTYVFNYGVASVQTRQPVTAHTLFELGSVTKTFTATLTSWAQVQRDLALSDPTSTYLPALRNTPFGNVTLLYLGTHTPGGLPLQVPDSVTNDEQLMQWLKSWRPAYTPGTYRTYNNPGIGTLGLIAARSMHQDFTALMQGRLFPALGMHSSYIDIPANKMSDYAWGYRNGRPVRMSPGELWSEAYGIRTTASDMIRFIQANMGLVPLDANLRRAVMATHTGYFKAGSMTQDLIWEQYPYPVSLDTLLEGNSAAMIFQPARASKIEPPLPPQANAWLDKTGSTNGFDAYVAFVPSKQLGIVILANENYPIKKRVTAAYEILAALAHGSGQEYATI